MLSAFLIVLFLVLATGMPVAFALGLTFLVLVRFLTDLPLILLPHQIMVGADNYSLVAIPFFMFAATIMAAGGITRRIVAALMALIGRVRGGLAITNVGASIVNGSFSGSAVADASMIGSIMIPPMKERGYSAPTAAAVTATSSVLGVIIPPSIPMIVLGAITGTSVLDMFMGGILPGLLIGVALIFAAWWVSCREGVPRGERLPGRAIRAALRDAMWALGLPIIVVGGIRLGVFTVVESSVIAVAYALIVSGLIYRELTPGKLYRAAADAAVTSAVVMLIVAAATGSAWLMASEQVPQTIAAQMSQVTDNPVVFMLIAVGFLLAVGMVIDLTPALLILGPILMPVAIGYGISPIHFAVVMVVTLAFGLVTPPVGTCLYLTASIARTSAVSVIRASLPLLAVMLVALLLIALVPGLSTWIPTAMR
ncbi:MAG: TRAP transporter large permease [Truepera sp.]|nr:TRAP transporter large permease [Truepera sp.]